MAAARVNVSVTNGRMGAPWLRAILRPAEAGRYRRIRFVFTLQDDLRCQTPIELREPGGPEALDFVEGRGGRLEQRRHVDALAARGERRQMARASGEHVHGPVVVPAPQVMEGDADLEDALVETAHFERLGAPEPLERFV